MCEAANSERVFVERERTAQEEQRTGQVTMQHQRDLVRQATVKLLLSRNGLLALMWTLLALVAIIVLISTGGDASGLGVLGGIGGFAGFGTFFLLQRMD